MHLRSSSPEAWAINSKAAAAAPAEKTSSLLTLRKAIKVCPVFLRWHASGLLVGWRLDGPLSIAKSFKNSATSTEKGAYPRLDFSQHATFRVHLHIFGKKTRRVEFATAIEAFFSKQSTVLNFARWGDHLWKKR